VANQSENLGGRVCMGCKIGCLHAGASPHTPGVYLAK
jgi:hypothetical protein